jgi:predicted nuclease of predicted toxin-antitoxin system
MPERDIRLLIDEDVWDGLAAALREAGYDAVSVAEIERKGFSDEDQLAHASAEQRAIITHNAQDFAPLAKTCFFQEFRHYGIIIARQFEKGTLLRRTLTLLDRLTVKSLANTLRFV